MSKNGNELKHQLSEGLFVESKKPDHTSPVEFNT